MTIFGKPLSQVRTQDLQELLDAEAVENVRLEFKQDVPTRDETLKKLSSFANTFGGVLLIGASAGSSDGRITGLPGVEPQASYKQTAVQWCFQGVSPPLTVEVSDPIPSPTAAERVCYVLRTAESDLAPHFLNGRKGVYIRTDEFSARFEPRLADADELYSLFDRRKLILARREELVERARARFHSFATRRRSETSTGNQSYFEIAIGPRFPSKPLCEHDVVARVLRETSLQWRSSLFPRMTQDYVSQHESTIVLGPGEDLSIVEANVWGLLLYATEIGKWKGENGIHLYGFIGHLLVFVRHAAAVLQQLGYYGPVTITMTLDSICGVPWIYADSGFPSTGPSSELDDRVSFDFATDTETLNGDPDSVAGGLLRLTFFATNWAAAVDTTEKVGRLVRKGYEYNLWTNVRTE